MNNSYKIILFSILIVLCAACEEEYVVITETEEEGQETIELVSTTIEGNVLDLSALPLSNVLIDLSVDNAILSSAISDEEGKFIFDNVSANEERTLLTFHHIDHATSYKILSPKEDLTHYTEAQLQENSISSFAANETISYSDDQISYSIESQQLDINGSGEIKAETNVIDEELISNNLLFPTNGINESGINVQLEHDLVVQIELFDSRDNAVSVLAGEMFELITNTAFDLDEFDLWFFNEREAIWQIDESSASNNNTTFTLNKTGLYSIAKRNQAYLITGILKDENGDPIPNVKITVRDENGKIINETFTNSVGGYEVQVNNDLKGNIVLSRDGSVVEEISFDDVADPELNTLTIIEAALTCKELVVDIELPNCEGVLNPSKMLEGDISSLVFFTLSIEGNNYGVMDPDELFDIVDWESLYGTTTSYTITHITGGAESEPCTNTITVKDALPPVLICVENLVVKLDEQMTALMYAQDIDEGSYANPCFGSSTLTFEIARNDKCDGECKDSDYGPSLEFTSEDVGKEIIAIMRVKDISGQSNSCWGTITVVE